MPQTQPGFDAAIQQFLAAAAATASNGLSWAAFGQLLDQLKILAIEEAQGLAISGYQKKQLVLAALGAFIDQRLPLPGYLFWARGMIKNLLLSLADGAIEAIYRKIIPATPPTNASLAT